MFNAPYTFTNKDSVARMIKSDAKPGESDYTSWTRPLTSSIGQDYLIVDVRDHDFAGGNIVNCRHIPSSEFNDVVSSLANELQGLKRVIFHCALSQQRGPSCALVYARERKKLFETNEGQAGPTIADADGQEVQVLRGGFTEFQAVYREDTALIEHYDKRYWT